MARTELVVTVGQHEERGDLADATGEELDQVERRFVSPVEIFDHDDHGRAARELLENGREDGPRRRPCVELRRERPSRLPGDVVNGPKWPWRVEGIAGAPECAARWRASPGEVLEERCLADAGFAEHQRHAPLAGRHL